MFCRFWPILAYFGLTLGPMLVYSLMHQLDQLPKPPRISRKKRKGWRAEMMAARKIATARYRIVHTPLVPHTRNPHQALIWMAVSDGLLVVESGRRGRGGSSLRSTGVREG